MAHKRVVLVVTLASDTAKDLSDSEAMAILRDELFKITTDDNDGHTWGVLAANQVSPAL